MPVTRAGHAASPRLGLALIVIATAQLMVGVSVSALIVLQATRAIPAIRQVAVYEPGLLMDTTGRYTRWVRRFDQEMARGQVADALITCIRGLDLAPLAFKVLPRRLLVAATKIFNCGGYAW